MLPGWVPPSLQRGNIESRCHTGRIKRRAAFNAGIAESSSRDACHASAFSQALIAELKVTTDRGTCPHTRRSY